MILVKVERLFLSNMGFVVVLKNPDEERSLPIFIGAPEAQSIAIQMQDVKVPRPLTHDLLKNLCDYLECRVKRVEVCEIRDGTYYGRLVVEMDGRDMEIDCRPSDAVALALRCACPIYVHEKVMAEAGRVMENVVEGGDAPSREAGAAPSRGSGPARPQTPLEVLNAKLERAIAEERYEEAAGLRDEINKLKQHTDN